MAEPLVRDLMHAGIVSCAPETPMPEVARQMNANDVSALAVVNAEGNLVGVISRTDLVVLRAHEEFWHGLRAEHVMHQDVMCVTPDTPLNEALNMLIVRRIHRLFVVDECGEHAKPIGVLSMTDIVRDMAKE
jgi:CBS domain-containing protein